ncbi:LysR substrate-binding domain-containing protein [Marinobacterium rhizophilum]|uniref:LysR family transcriptional regulator n=1 Tax=Marinobacterium rhizophilum TaxID=420402 RepID=A0ABY5HIP1_9GAMM|nr:LysR substrate-binding domain-containing protein [Marinobacterium rhizophilum]UTW11964.1 LysR family transcriptional regulator [Marinobacterium rhizophilum]
MLRTQIRSFHAVAKAGSYTLASKDLNVGQPTLTTQVKTLEERYEVELFQKKGRGVVLTHAGSELFEITSKISMHEREIELLLSTYKGLTRGQLHIAAVSPFHVVDILTVFQARYPNIEVLVTLGNSYETLEKVLVGKVDVGIFAWEEDEIPNVILEHYRTHNVVVFANKEHPFYKRDSIFINELEGQNVILREDGSTTRRAFELSAKKAGVNIKPYLVIGSREGVWQSVKRGLGISVVADSEFISHPDMQKIPITDVDITTRYFLSYLKDREKSRLIRAFSDAAQEAKNLELI